MGPFGTLSNEHLVALSLVSVDRRPLASRASDVKSGVFEVTEEGLF